ncbi:hypothetical protein EGR_02943 [Echinococcus granulosus]|uniref:Uncharacterized protein n=1 Tax=Echinococcus granulosus TaxID=6210 RepID=W6UM29_ECHGR|nr:hypothetical protein EGR_02943 [Echinococcus granulosus]EUB62191.1 hypothetical protein EGR_02943 [Echinococcus granulosus]
MQFNLSIFELKADDQCQNKSMGRSASDSRHIHSKRNMKPFYIYKKIKPILAKSSTLKTFLISHYVKQYRTYDFLKSLRHCDERPNPLHLGHAKSLPTKIVGTPPVWILVEAAETATVLGAIITGSCECMLGCRLQSAVQKETVSLFSHFNFNLRVRFELTRQSCESMNQTAS